MHGVEGVVSSIVRDHSIHSFRVTKDTNLTVRCLQECVGVVFLIFFALHWHPLFWALGLGEMLATGSLL